MTAQLILAAIVVVGFLLFVTNNLGIAGRYWSTRACWIFMLSHFGLGIFATTADIYPLSWMWALNVCAVIVASAELSSRRRPAHPLNQNEPTTRRNP